MSIPILERGVQGEHSFIVHFKDGTMGVVDNIDKVLKGRKLDEIVMIELFPSGGGQIDAHQLGKPVRGLQLELKPSLPFPIRVVFPLDVAKMVGSNMAGKPHIVTAQPSDLGRFGL